MKILQINNCHYRRGGADVVYLNTIGLLKANGQQVVEFSQLSDKNEETEFAGNFVETYDVLNLSFVQKIQQSPRLLYSDEARKKLADLIEKTRPDIAHIHLYKGILTVSILPVLKKYKIPVVITLHDFSLLCPRNLLLDGDNKICEKCITSSTFNCIIKRCNRKNLFFSTMSFLEYNLNNNLYKPEDYFDKIISVSKFNFNKHLLKNNLAPKLVQLYNFFPGMHANLPGTGKGNYFLFFGRLSVEKGLTTLFNAAKLLDKSIKIKVAGTGPMEEELKQRLLTEDISNIEMLGYKTGKELETLIANCSFIIVSSECYENNPMTIVEGYSYGKPVIGSRVGGIPELIEHGKTGYQYEMGNHVELAEVISTANNITPDCFEEFSVNARQFAQDNFSDEVHYEKLMSIYRSATVSQAALI
ncbi:MAG: glycosyltransferase family 4 [Ferruginibacter sp.]|uniref:glycosyltransferase n=1 Tax=Ferruginibacter sp. TaxID=1940288 RepID=UPI002657C02F|nr:glycosyltransferase [Ferruginibacter sp.]MDB5280396.1 glycosyltransferase family 4 [Ferruginibacter sp.]